jgi:hypothetical protein
MKMSPFPGEINNMYQIYYLVNIKEAVLWEKV